MPRTILTAVLALALIMLTGCGDTHDKVAADMMDTMEDFNKTMENVKDVDSAKDASDDLRKIAERMNSITERANALEEPDEETKKALEEKYKTRMEEIGKNLFSNMMRVASLGPEVQQVLDDAMKDLEKQDSPEWFR